MTKPEISNGEKRVLWRFVNVLIAICAAGALLLGTINGWAIKDYLDFKEDHAQMERQNVSYRAAMLERMKWQETVFLAIAKKMGIPVPPPPEPITTESSKTGR